MTDERVDEDVAVVGDVLSVAHVTALPHIAIQIRDDAEPALDRLQARLEAAEADVKRHIRLATEDVRAERDEARANAERLKKAAVIAWRNIGVPDDNYPAPLAEAYRALNEALAAEEGE